MAANEATSADPSVISPASIKEHKQQQLETVAPSESGRPNELTGDTNNIGDVLERSNSINEDYVRYLSNPQNVEKRFPVDRKKLERLIVAGGKSNETADEFFKTIQDMTETLILWPSRLKIGAKSKKDPQVKVIGLPASVQKARELILSELDAKSTRVTLKIDVAFAEHSHVIGKEGINIKKVHDETKCHIHFPDSKRLTYGEKSNQVSITGQVVAVETARKRIRELLPVVVSFMLPIPGRIDTTSPEIQKMMVAYNVNIYIKPQPRQYTMSVIIRGTVRYLDGLKLAVSKIVEYYTGDIHMIPPITLTLDVAAQHHRTFIGQNGGNLRKIIDETRTSVKFPDPLSRYQSNQVEVTGTTEDIFIARDLLLGCLPVVLMFDVHESDENVLSSSIIGDLMQQLDVFISVKPKKGQLQSVIIKSIEQNMECVYQARLRLLECSCVPTVPVNGVTMVTTNDGPLLNKARGIHGNRAPSTAISTITEETQEELPSPNELHDQSVNLKPVTPTKETRLTSPELRTEDRFRESSAELETSISPTDMRPRSQSASSNQQLTTPTHRLTPRQFIDWDRKREEAQIAMKTKVQSSEPRYPSTYFAGSYFSKSQGPQANKPSTATSPSTVAQGLISINRTGQQALIRQASQERMILHSEQDSYQGITDLSSLLQKLGLEHYQKSFDEEEVDFDTFLTMSESDLKEVGITTIGARRKLQLAISDLKKGRGKQHQFVSSPGRRSYHTLPIQPSASVLGGGMSLNKSSSLKRTSSYSKSNSGRF